MEDESIISSLKPIVQLLLPLHVLMTKGTNPPVFFRLNMKGVMLV